MTIQFTVDHLDPMGQGVYKDLEKVFFIPKTLPGETGQAKVLKKRKKVHFAQLMELHSQSLKRIQAECPHYQKCNGCHYLHTDYQTELDFKRSALERILRNLLGSVQIDTIQGSRFNYRNRIQLHYDLKQDAIGYLDASGNEIISMEHCLLPVSQIQAELKDFLSRWRSLAKQEKLRKGHVELYWLNNRINLSWNRPYASLGFTQVNQEQNQKLQSLVEKLLWQDGHVLDLFGGNGNLSLKASSRLVVDYYEKTSAPDKISLDLFADDSLQRFMSLGHSHFDSVIVDPPRSGFGQLANWMKSLAPKQIIYISCHPQTMARDLERLGDSYVLKKCYLVDLFPGTFHMEAVCYLERKSFAR